MSLIQDERSMWPWSPASDKVSDGDHDIGTVLNVAGSELLAVVPVSQADSPLFVNGAALRHQALPYL